MRAYGTDTGIPDEREDDPSDSDASAPVTECLNAVERVVARAASILGTLASGFGPGFGPFFQHDGRFAGDSRLFLADLAPTDPVEDASPPAE